MIDSSLRIHSENEAKQLKKHLVFASRYYYLTHEEQLRSMILKAMKKYKMKKVMVTMICLMRWKIITQENMENFCRGREIRKDSINDDLESFFGDL